MDVHPTLLLQRWGGGADEERALSPASAEVLTAAMRSMRDDLSAILTIEAASGSLIVSASRGRFTVTALLGEDNTFDLVGDAAATGTVAFVLGGQEIAYPRRYLTGGEAAQAAAREFFHTGTVRLEGGHWERQGPGSAWA